MAGSPTANTPIPTEYRRSLRSLGQLRTVKKISNGTVTQRDNKSTQITKSRGAVTDGIGASNIGRGHLARTSRAKHASMYTPTMTNHGITQATENHHSTRALPLIFASNRQPTSLTPVVTNAETVQVKSTSRVRESDAIRSWSSTKLRSF
jgi:hypothetical protein